MEIHEIKEKLEFMYESMRFDSSLEASAQANETIIMMLDYFDDSILKPAKAHFGLAND